MSFLTLTEYEKEPHPDTNIVKFRKIYLYSKTHENINKDSAILTIKKELTKLAFYGIIIAVKHTEKQMIPIPFMCSFLAE